MNSNNAKLIIIIISMISLQTAHMREVTICDCESPSLVGLLDMSTPENCTTKSQDNILQVAYEEVTLEHEPLIAEGYLCKKWLRNLTIIGHWDGFCEEKLKRMPIDLTSQECLTMSEDLKCGNQKMVAEGQTAYYDAEPTGKCHWLSTDVYFNYNCQLEVYNVTQDCPTYPIKSPYGILQEDPTEEKTGLRRGHTTLSWKKTEIPDDYECQYRITRIGRATLIDAGNPNQQHLRDYENQLEFIINPTPTSICKFTRVHKLAGAPNTYIRYTVLDTDKLKE